MDLDEATQAVAEQLDRDVVVFDTELNLIAFSAHREDVDRGRLAIILTRRATPRAMKMISEARAKDSPTPVVLPRSGGVNARVLVPLRYQDRLYGYLSFSIADTETESVVRSNTELLDQVAARIGSLLALREHSQREEATLQHRLLTRLVGDDPEQRAEAAAALVEDGVLAPSDEYVVVSIATRAAADREPSQAALTLQDCIRVVTRMSRFPAAGTVVDAHGVIVLPGRADAELLERILREGFGERIVAGVGGTRAVLTEVHDSLREARIARDAIERLPGFSGLVAQWDLLGLDRVLVQLPLSGLRMEDLPPSVVRLLHARSAIDLATTLECYLRCGGSIGEAAQMLHIHRSTLYYRLDKIRELTGENLTDGLVRSDLHTGLRIARLAGFWPAGPVDAAR